MRNPSKAHVQILVHLLRLYGIQHVVVCPGSRNAPIIEALASDGSFALHSVVDERSAAFVALGIIDCSNKPAAVCCTSGTAAYNLGPAIAEAYYRAMPLVAISADRPTRQLYQMDGQTVPQVNFFREITTRSINIEDESNAERLSCIARDISGALLALEHPTRGPIHINIHIDEPIHALGGTVPVPCRKLRRVATTRPNLEASVINALRSKKVMLLLGQSPASTRTENAVEILSSLGCAVLAEHCANVSRQESVISRFDCILQGLGSGGTECLVPDILITAGGHIVSKRIKQLLRQHKPSEHWHLHQAEPTPIPDPYLSLTHIFDSDLLSFAQALELAWGRKHSPLAAADYPATWTAFRNHLPVSPSGGTDTSLSAIGLLLGLCKEKSHVLLGNSSIVRLAEYVPIPRTCRVYANRGTSGIDGILSTAVGIALSTQEDVWAIIGDLSAFYDMNVLRHSLPPNLRIVVLNNGGGGIFYQLPSLRDKISLREFIGAGHRNSLQGWAKECGLNYYSPKTEEQLRLYIQSPHCDKATLVEVFTNIERDATAIELYRQHISAAMK